ncbi:hypothetical protein SAMN04515695_3229 [Pseudovibrio sp. Tun.PSC04-5.I4]|nr:hypothetical protein SAMN04515695_3229 [Pseudovibrio sp. Tun.PSC04-5.I4]
MYAHYQQLSRGLSQEDTGGGSFLRPQHLLAAFI